ncbi:hypothetical protein PAXINDRAFT_6975 [Paxillus involutus ATCC 200175]|nr:hypothetical protein PAXINDRAFT_6975 [Paxillus involutus ATCC 200175]
MSDTTIPHTTRKRSAPAVGSEHAQTGVEECVVKRARISATPPPQGGGHSSPSLNKTPYLLLKQVGTYWHGRSSLKDLIVFGDSYSTSAEQEADEDCEDDPSSFTWIVGRVSKLVAPLLRDDHLQPPATLLVPQATFTLAYHI